MLDADSPLAALAPLLRLIGGGSDAVEGDSKEADDTDLSMSFADCVVSWLQSLYSKASAVHKACAR